MDMGNGERRPRRVFLGLVEVAGYYRNLRDGLEALGVECLFVDLSGNPFDYQSGRQPVGIRMLERLAVWKARTRGPVRLALALMLSALKVPLLLWAAARFDTFVFGYRSTFLGYRELPWLRRLGKKIVYCFQGSDARPAYLDGSVMAPEHGRSIADCLHEVRRTRRALAHIERHADAIISHSPYAQFQRRPFVAWLAIGIPTPPVGGATTPGPLGKGGATRILHAPSHAAAKGTDEIRRLIARAEAAGHRLEYTEIMGQPNAVVKRELQRTDLVFDQLYSDTPMAGLASEAAGAGVPALVGGYESASIVAAAPEGRLPPTVYCDPDSTYEALVALVGDAGRRAEIGAAARTFVDEQWAVLAVAKRWLRIVEGDVPNSWLVDPQTIRHVHGVGMSEDRTRKLIRDVISEGGESALGLDDKPELRDALVAFACER
ncbi:MAG: hypothetical protein JO148_08805 [Acidimicrobiia bacterium]|nr:hypothetical protein [Acidimicrobiia bacterium]